MKITKLMLSAFVAAMALVSCNKETHTPEVANLKTVEISLKNIVMTKGPAGEKIEANDKGEMPPIEVKNFKVFLTDQSYYSGYSAWNAEGTKVADFYFTGADNLTEVQQFHYVDHKCTKVVVVANMGDVSFEQVMSINTPIANQQDQSNLILYGEMDLQSTGRQHTNVETGDLTDIYEANVMLYPTISRFEVDGFAVSFSSNPAFDKVEVTDIAFQHYFPHLAFNTNDDYMTIAGAGSHTLHIATADLENDAKVFQWFNGTASTGWFRDSFNPALAMTPSSPKADAPAPLAYHFYSGEAVPTMMIKLLADGVPAYVYTSKYKISEKDYLTVLKPGKIYRMSGAGITSGDGSVVIPDDLDPIQRCIEVSVEVLDWSVQLITPEF